MTEPSLRIERIGDLNAAQFAQLVEAFPDDGWVQDQTSAFVGNPDNLLAVAYWDDVPCGWLTAHRLQRLDEREAEVLIYEIGVEEAYQRRGAGRALIDEAKRWAAEVGADEAWVLTNRSNAAAMALYRATGGIEDEPDVTMFTFPIEGRRGEEGEQ